MVFVAGGRLPVLPMLQKAFAVPRPVSAGLEKSAELGVGNRRLVHREARELDPPPEAAKLKAVRILEGMVGRRHGIVEAALAHAHLDVQLQRGGGNLNHPGRNAGPRLGGLNGNEPCPDLRCRGIPCPPRVHPRLVREKLLRSPCRNAWSVPDRKQPTPRGGIEPDRSTVRAGRRRSYFPAGDQVEVAMARQRRRLPAELPLPRSGCG